MKTAAGQGKQIVLYFHADWCTYCTKLKETTFKDNDVIQYLDDNFISIAVDTDQNRELANEWQVKGLPTIWFLKADGTKISSVPGYVDEKQFMNMLEYIHTESFETMSFSQFLKSS